MCQLTLELPTLGWESRVSGPLQLQGELLASSALHKTDMRVAELTSMVEVKSRRTSNPVALPWIMLTGRHSAAPACAHAFAKAMNASSESAKAT